MSLNSALQGLSPSYDGTPFLFKNLKKNSLLNLNIIFTFLFLIKNFILLYLLITIKILGTFTIIDNLRQFEEKFGYEFHTIST